MLTPWINIRGMDLAYRRKDLTWRIREDCEGDLVPGSDVNAFLEHAQLCDPMYFALGQINFSTPLAI
jgi:hypothetical protein